MAGVDSRCELGRLDRKALSKAVASDQGRKGRGDFSGGQAAAWTGGCGIAKRGYWHDCRANGLSRGAGLSQRYV